MQRIEQRLALIDESAADAEARNTPTSGDTQGRLLSLNQRLEVPELELCERLDLVRRLRQSIATLPGFDSA